MNLKHGFDPKLKFVKMNMIYGQYQAGDAIYIAFDGLQYISVFQRNIKYNKLYFSWRILPWQSLYSSMMIWIQNKMIKYLASHSTEHLFEQMLTNLTIDEEQNLHKIDKIISNFVSIYSIFRQKLTAIFEDIYASVKHTMNKLYCDSK